jgi:hypothetical protein
MVESELELFALSKLFPDSLKPFSMSATSDDSRGLQNKGLLLDTRTCN